MDAVSREQLLADLGTLVGAIESTHPDPFTRCGGRVAFYQAVHEVAKAIPAGNAAAAVDELFAPVVAQVHDGHTWLRAPEPAASHDVASGFWVFYQVVDGELVVTRTYGPELSMIIGHRLSRVNGIGVPELLGALEQVVGADNEVELAVRLGAMLSQPDKLARLCQRAAGGAFSSDRVELQLLDPADAEHTVTIRAEPLPAEATINQARSSIEVPDFADADLGWARMPADPSVMYLRSRMCAGFREAYEIALSRGASLTIGDRRLHERFADRADPDGHIDPVLLREVPSAAEGLGRLCDTARETGARHLLVDVRDNPGGISVIAGFMVAAFYGMDEVERPLPAYDVPRISALLREHYLQQPSHAEPLTGGLDFTWYDRSRAAQPGDRQDRYEGHLAAATSFQTELSRRGRGPWWQPEYVVVLTNSGTYSSGMSIVNDLVRAGAITAGTPSGQSGNCFGDSLSVELPNSKATLFVSNRQIHYWPDDPDRGHLLHPDLPVTYSDLAALDFDPNAAVAIALKWLHSQ